MNAQPGTNVIILNKKENTVMGPLQVYIFGNFTILCLHKAASGNATGLPSHTELLQYPEDTKRRVQMRGLVLRPPLALR